MLFNRFKKNNDVVIYSPISGKTIPIEEIPDAVFSSKCMGDGLAIEPTDEIVVSPVNGTIKVLASTKHAIGIVMDNGLELLIHIGIDTVNLNGQYFTAFVKSGQYVEIGQELIEFDRKGIRAKGIPVTTMVIVTNSDRFKLKKFSGNINIKSGDVLAKAYE